MTGLSQRKNLTKRNKNYYLKATLSSGFFNCLLGGGKLKLKEIRCKKCNRLIGKVKGAAEIKCPRCATVNIVKDC